MPLDSFCSISISPELCSRVTVTATTDSTWGRYASGCSSSLRPKQIPSRPHASATHTRHCSPSSLPPPRWTISRGCLPEKPRTVWTHTFSTPIPVGPIPTKLSLPFPTSPTGGIGSSAARSCNRRESRLTVRRAGDGELVGEEGRKGDRVRCEPGEMGRRDE